MGKSIELTAGDGFRLSAYRADPAGTPRGGVVVAQEIFGVNGHIRAVCDGFAQDGYVVVAPALFDRSERGVDMGYGEADIARGRELKSRSPLDPALVDIAAACDAARPAGKVAVIGYCWGGYLAWMASARLDGLACAVTYYGGGMPDAIDAKPRCPVLSHFGLRDTAIPVAGVRKLEAAHPEVQVLLYDAGHGFNCTERASYDPAAATKARAHTLTFLREHVG